MLRYTTDRARPGLVALYDIRPENGAGPFLQPRSRHRVLFGKGNINRLAMFWDTMDSCVKLLKAESEVNQQEGEEEFKCYTIRQMIVALLIYLVRLNLR